MAGISEEPEIEIDEYEEIVGNWDQASVREGATDIRAVSIQDPTSDEQFNFMTHTERPALRPVERSFTREVNESHTVVVKGAVGWAAFLLERKRSCWTENECLANHVVLNNYCL